MRNPGAHASPRAVVLLEAALLREARLWKAPTFKNGGLQGTDISSSHHQEIVLWLGEMNRLFQFCPETFALGVCVLNRLLSTVKAQPKYLKCIAFTSLLLAAKIHEEDEVIGSIRDLVALCGCNFSIAEILRMERIILDKLQWDLYVATAVDFIHILDRVLYLTPGKEDGLRFLKNEVVEINAGLMHYLKAPNHKTVRKKPLGTVSASHASLI